METDSMDARPRPVLPASGEVAIERLAAVLKEYRATIGRVGTVSARSILLRKQRDDGWTHAATVLRVGVSDPPPASDFLWGRARCLARTFDLSECSSAEGLAELLVFWRSCLSHDARPRIGSIYSTRYASRSQFGLEPCWMCRVHVNDLDPYDTGGHYAPQYNPHLRLLADDLNALARQWLRIPYEIIGRNLGTEVHLIVTDQRAVLSDLSIKDLVLTATIDGLLAAECECTVSTVNPEGNTWDHVAENNSGVIRTELPYTPSGLKIRLWSPAAELLDEYVEREYQSSWGESLLSENRTETLATVKELVETLSEGEGDTVEFKAWVPLHRQDGKLLECFETLVAFSNTKGGRLYIGVDDYGEPVDVTRHISQTFKKQTDTDDSEKRALYVQSLQKVVAEAISPTMLLTFRWVTLANHWILQVDVGAGEELPYEIVEGHHFLVRRGATNRRMSRSELMIAMRQQPGIGHS